MFLKHIRVLIMVMILTGCESAYIVDSYQDYIISKGGHSSTHKIQMLQSKQLKFKVIFDESAIYQSLTEENQHDVHKLLGFSDCNSHHHQNSARFGWRWLDDQLEILAYCYSDADRIIESIGVISLDEPYDMSLSMSNSAYEFRLGDFPVVKIERQIQCSLGGHYLLFPYFGGDEVAPHDILIKLQIIY